jgi:hypothetical protein
LFVFVVRERQSLDVSVDRAPPVVHYPLAHTGGEPGFGVGADRAGDGQCREGRELQRAKPVAAEHGYHQVVQPSVSLRGAGMKNVVENNFQGPWLQPVGRTLADDHEEAHRQGAPVWA